MQQNHASFPFYIEDFYEIIAGFRDVKGKTTSTFWFSPIINLARYDNSFISNISELANNKQPWTKKQGDLAVQLLDKYHRQLASHGVDVSEAVKSPMFRQPLRVPDTTTLAYVENDKLKIKFPYNPILIEQVRDIIKTSQGSLAWNRDERYWESALTETNVAILLDWAKQNNFEIDARAQELLDLVNAESSIPFAIELTEVDGVVTISNAEDSLIKYISDKVTLSKENIVQLADLSGECGFTLSDKIANEIKDTCGEWMLPFMTNRDLFLPSVDNLSVDDVRAVVEYAETVGRTPVVIYEPDLSNKILGLFAEVVGQENIEVIKNKKTGDTTKKILHTVRPIELGEIPMVVSGSGMTFGASKQLMIQNARKVVYFSSGVYNKASRKLSI